MCFSDDSDCETRSVRVFDHHHHHSHPHIHHHSHRIPFPPRFRRSVYAPPHHLPPLHYPHHHHHPHPHRTEDTTIIYNPRHSPHCSPPPSPQSSYTTISRRHVRTRRETIEPVSFGLRTFWGRERECEAPRYIEYVEREPGRRRCEGRDVEYIPCR